jgi:hypothetical protein
MTLAAGLTLYKRIMIAADPIARGPAQRPKRSRPCKLLKKHVQLAPKLVLRQTVSSILD